MTESTGWRRPEGSLGATDPAQPPPGGWGPPPGAPGHGYYAPRPGIVPLRPLRLGEIYDGAFGAVRTNPRAVLGWSAVIVVIMVVIDTISTYVFERHFLGSVGGLASLFSAETTPGGANRILATEEDSAAGIAATYVVTLAVQLIAQSLLSGVVIVSVSAGVLGRRVGAAALWERVKPRLLPLVGLSLLTTLITFVAFVVCLIPGGIVLAAARGSNSGLAVGAILIVLGVLAAVVIAIGVVIRLLLAAPALVLEPQTVRAAISRSWRLTRHGFWRILGIYLLAAVGLAIAAGVVSVPFTVLGGALSGLVGSGDGAVAVRLAVSAVGTAIASTIIYPVQAAVVALLYIDQRMRTEGLDVELAQAASTPA